MSSRSQDPSTSPRVRPVTWVILAWVIIMIAAIVGAWQGSEARYGAVPEITVATDRGHQKVPPYEATDLGQNTYSNPVAEFELNGQDAFAVRLPVELHSSPLNIREIRAGGDHDRTVEPDGSGHLRIPVTTPELGRIEGLVIQSAAFVYAADGSEDILSAEWSVRFTHRD